jgi:capsular polysaccharide biosynthesis protein
MDLRFALETLWNRRTAVALVLAAGILFAFVAGLRVRGAYTATASVLMVPGTNTVNDLIPTTSTKPLLADDLPLLAQSAPVLKRASRDLGGDISTRDLEGRIRTDIYQSSNVMRIRFRAKTPQLAVEGANAVANEVVNYYRTIATSRFDSLASDLKLQLAHRQAELRAMDAQLQDMSAQYPYIEYGTGASERTSLNGLLVQLESQRDQMMATLSGDVAEANVTGQRTSEAAPLARQEFESQNPFYRNVLEQYGRDAAQLRQDQTQYNSNYPGLPELQDIVRREQAELSADQQNMDPGTLSATEAYAQAVADENKAQSLVASDRAKLDQINSTIMSLQGQLTNSESGGVNVEALRRDRESAEKAYELLSIRLITTLADRAAAASTGSLMVFDYASRAERSPYTVPMLICVAILMVATWLAVTLAFALEAFDRRFRTPRVIEGVYGSPVLGVI